MTGHGPPLFDPGELPLPRLAALLLDVGGTLVTIDFEWMADELEDFGLRFTPGQIQRAEAAARPGVSETLARLDAEDVAVAFTAYMRAILGELARREPGRFHPAHGADEEGASPETGPPAKEGDPGSRQGPTIPSAIRPTIDKAAQRLISVFDTPRGGRRLWSRVVPGIPEALSSLTRAGLPLGAVSNSDGTVEELLVELGLRDYFEAIIDSGVVGHAKPDPRIFEIALARLGAGSDRALHAGDMYFADVVGARRAGLAGVLVDPYGDWPGADCPRVRDVGELARLILAARDAGESSR